jgi:hypothetical protein
LVFRIIRSSKTDSDSGRRKTIKKVLKSDPLHGLRLVEVQQHVGSAIQHGRRRQTTLGVEHRPAQRV